MLGQWFLGRVMWAGQMVYGVEKLTLVGVWCRQVTGLCMGKEDKRLDDGSEEAGRTGEGSARIAWHKKYWLCKQGKRVERPENK